LFKVPEVTKETLKILADKKLTPDEIIGELFMAEQGLFLNKAYIMRPYIHTKCILGMVVVGLGKRKFAVGDYDLGEHITFRLLSVIQTTRKVACIAFDYFIERRPMVTYDIRVSYSREDVDTFLNNDVSEIVWFSDDAENMTKNYLTKEIIKKL